MKLEVDDADTYKIVRYSGVVDGSAREPTYDLVHPIIEQNGSRVLVDLSGVERINSEGIGVFVTLVSRANQKGSRVVFVQPSPLVKAVFDVTKITQFLTTEDSIDQGIDRLLKPKPKVDG